MVEGPDTERAETNRPFRPRLSPLVAVVIVTNGGLALLPVPAQVPSEESVLDLDFASPQWMSRSWHPGSGRWRSRRLAIRTGLADLRFHDLRHTHAAFLIAAGEHPKIIQTEWVMPLSRPPSTFMGT